MPDQTITQANPKTRRMTNAELATLSDENLFAYYAATESDSVFREIDERYRSRIRGFFLKRIQDLHDAEDRTQEVFLRMHRARKDYDPRRNFATWTHTIAMNVLKNHYRSKSRDRLEVFTDKEKRSSRSGAMLQFDFACSRKNPEQMTYNTEIGACTRAALHHLEPAVRRPFILHELLGYSYDEISIRLGIPAGKLKSRMHRARTQLRRTLRKIDPGLIDDPGTYRWFQV